jgi:hypothetical protein
LNRRDTRVRGISVESGFSKQGDRHLQRILLVGAIAVLRRAQENPGKYPWLTQLLARRPFKVVAVALANKNGAHGLGADDPRRHLSGMSIATLDGGRDSRRLSTQLI